MAGDDSAPPPAAAKGRPGSWACSAGLVGNKKPSLEGGCAYVLKPNQHDKDEYETNKAAHRRACQAKANQREITLSGRPFPLRPTKRVEKKCTLCANECCDGNAADGGYQRAAFDGLRDGDSIWFFRGPGCKDKDLVQVVHRPRQRQTNGMAITGATAGTRLELRGCGGSAQVRRKGDSPVVPWDCSQGGSEPVLSGPILTGP